MFLDSLLLEYPQEIGIYMNVRLHFRGLKTAGPS